MGVHSRHFQKAHHTHRSERGLAVVNVPDGSNVDVRLVALERRELGRRSRCSWQSWFRGYTRGAESAAELEGLRALRASAGRGPVGYEAERHVFYHRRGNRHSGTAQQQWRCLEQRATSGGGAADWFLRVSTFPRVACGQSETLSSTSMETQSCVGSLREERGTWVRCGAREIP